MSVGEVLQLIDFINGVKDRKPVANVLSDFASATGPDDIRFIQRSLPSYGVAQNKSLLELQKHGDELLKEYEGKTRAGALSRFAQDYGENTNLPPAYVLAYQTPEDRQMIAQDPKGLDDFIRGLNTGVKDLLPDKQKQSDRVALEQFRTAESNLYGGKQDWGPPTQEGVMESQPYLPSREQGMSDLARFAVGVPENELQRAQTQWMNYTKPETPQKPEKEYDPITQEAATFLTGKGFKMLTPEGRQQALDWFGTPAGQKEWKAYIDQTSAARYNPPPMHPSFSFVGITPQGQPVTFDNRHGTVGGDISQGIQPKVEERPSATEREKTANLESLVQQLDYIETAYKENPNFVGIASGRLGALTQLGNSGEATFRREVDSVKDALLRAKSGAQINEQEYKRLAKIVPSYTDSQAQFTGKMKGFRRELNTILTARQKTQRGVGVVVPQGQSTAPSTPQGNGKRPLPKF